MVRDVIMLPVLASSVVIVSRLFSVFVAFIASFLLIGSAHAEVKVLTSIKPLQLIATAVQDGVAIPEVLLPPGASPHNYALRPSDVRKVQSVDLLYWIGPDMEGFLPRVLNGRTLPSVAFRICGMKLRRFAEDSHSHAEDADEHDHDHRPGNLDAHLWLSPINARVIAAKMAADLSAADPANAARYQSNLKAFDERLDALDLRLKKRLAGIEGKPYFVFPAASITSRTLMGSSTPEFSVLQPKCSPAPSMSRRCARGCRSGQDLRVQRTAAASAGGNPGGRAAGETGGTGCAGRIHARDCPGYEQVMEKIGQ